MNILNYPFEDVPKPFNFMVKGEIEYKGKSIYKLLNYSEKNRCYDFEDRNLILYDPTTPSPKAYLFMELKRMFPITDYMYLSENLCKIMDTIDYLHFRLFSSDRQYFFDGFIFSEKFLSEPKKTTQHKGITFVEKYGVLVDDINFDNISRLSKKISTIDGNVLSKHLLKPKE